MMSVTIEKSELASTVERPNEPTKRGRSGAIAEWTSETPRMRTSRRSAVRGSPRPARRRASDALRVPRRTP
jgi:hypothetical protein